MDNVKNKKPNVSNSNKGHDGKYGHWLETQMKIPHNRNNAPDLWGFEMKNNTKTKTTFGDWNADYYIFRDPKYFNTKNKPIENRDIFMAIFGSPNPEKKNRYSWSGKPTPKIKNFNEFGQKLKIDNKNNIIAIYSFSKDKRKDKLKIIPREMQKDNLVLARWDYDSIKIKVESKFNKLGWFKCEQNKSGIYTNIIFGKPINFETWIDGVKRGLIYFDSGMHVGNSRFYSEWRANNSYWDSLIDERY